MSRSVMLVVHPGRPNAVRAARDLGCRLQAAGIVVRVLEREQQVLDCAGAVPVAAEAVAAGEPELLVALGGDGTLLRAAEIARPARTPLLGVNLGHVGFLAEADRVDLEVTAERITSREYDVEERLTIDVVVRREAGPDLQDWALNDVSVEKAARQRMLDLVLEIDDRPLSRWGCDGVVCATPTGSTAYAFSAGGPVVWPSVRALLVVPLSAHALFARPLVVAPEARVAIEIAPEARVAIEPADEPAAAVMFCDGRRTHDLRPRDRLEVACSDLPVRLVRLRSAPFTDRLVEKFALPVQGWRGRAAD